MIKLLIEGDVTAPERGYGNNGIDFFVPNDTPEFRKALIDANNNEYFDFCSYFTITDEGIVLKGGMNCDIKIPSFIHPLIPDGVDIRFVDKSGVGTKKKLFFVAKEIDYSYEGDMTFHLVNFGRKDQLIRFGEKIAQGVPNYTDNDPIQVYTLNDVSHDEFYRLHKSDRKQKGFSEGTGNGLDPVKK